jgi:hypothetical protein
MNYRYPEDYKVTYYEANESENVRFALGNTGNNTLLCFGINPSTANNNISDPTMNRLICFSWKHRYDSCIMLNTYPLRCSKPFDLPQTENIMVQEQNLKHIEHVFQQHEGCSAIAIWGDFIMKRTYLCQSVRSIVELSQKYTIRWKHIGNLSKEGNPYHFSYLYRSQSKDMTLNDFDALRYVSDLEQYK